jgi:hypothetical protein
LSGRCYWVIWKEDWEEDAIGKRRVGRMLRAWGSGELMKMMWVRLEGLA